MAEGVASQAQAIRRAIGRIQGGGPRNLTKAGARRVTSARGARRAGALQTSRQGRAARSALKSGAAITGRQAARQRRRGTR